jgi:hypothetical protein
MARIIPSISTALIVLAALTAFLPSAAARQFKKAVYYKLNDLPYSVVTADFNHDGNLDLAVAEYFTGQVGILLGKGNGAFHAPHYFSAPGAIGLAVGDFGGNHRQDLAVVESGGTGYGALAIFLSNGNGTFRESATYPLGIEPFTAAVADFDGDGHLDIAVQSALGYGKNGKEGAVLVFFGKGDGTFGKPAIYRVPNFPGSIAAGDFDGDGHPDLAVTQADTDSVAVLMNDGHGKFKLTGEFSSSPNSGSVTAADLRGNGVLDLVVAGGASSIAVLLGNGDGTFEKAVLYSTSQLGTANVYATVVSDFNLDGTPDIAGVFGQGYPDHLGVLFYGNGDGTFGPPHAFQGEKGSGGYWLTTGDFNMDGAPDLAVSDYASGAAAVLLNTR